MKLLLDTHVWLWWTAGSKRIDPGTRKLFDERTNELVLSAASAWEIAIKFRIGRIALPSNPQDYIPLQIARQSIGTLNVTVTHAAATATLPLFHSDPFDRILVAQAVCEGMTLVTADRAIASYAVAQLRV